MDEVEKTEGDEVEKTEGERVEKRPVIEGEKETEQDT